MRKAIAQEVIQSASNIKSDLYQLQEGITSYKSYVDLARESFPLVSPQGIDKSQMSFDQADDVLLDWVENKRAVLIYIPEIAFNASFEPRRVISHYLTEKYIIEEYHSAANDHWFRMVMTTDYRLEGVYPDIELYFGRDERDKRTVEEIARNHIAILHVDQCE